MVIGILKLLQWKADTPQSLIACISFQFDLESIDIHLRALSLRRLRIKIERPSWRYPSALSRLRSHRRNLLPYPRSWCHKNPASGDSRRQSLNTKTSHKAGFAPYRCGKFEYIKYLLERMPGIPLTDENLEKLMPWSHCIPSCVKNPEK